MNIKNWSWYRWFGLGLAGLSLWLIGYHTSYWVSLGIFLWTWSCNIDKSDL